MLFAVALSPGDYYTNKKGRVLQGGTLACIYLCNVLNRPSACAISAIVCCSIMLSHSGQERYFYTVARMLETAVGILVAMAVNHVLPGKPEASKADP